MPGQDGGAQGGRRARLGALLGDPAQPGRSQVAPPTRPAPTSVRAAALVVAVEAVLAGALALVLLWLAVAGHPGSVGRALAEVVYVAIAAGALAVGARGLRRVSSWARGPVVVLQLLLGLIGYTLALPAGRPLLGMPVLALAVLGLVLLFTPQARLAFLERQPPG